MSDSNKPYKQFEALFSDSDAGQTPAAAELETLRAQIAELEATNTRAQAAETKERQRRETLQAELSMLQTQIGARTLPGQPPSAPEAAPASTQPAMAGAPDSLVNRIRQLLASPVFEDVEKTRIAGALNSILLSIIGFASLFTIASAFISTSPMLVAVRIVAIIVFFAFLGLFAGFRRGYIRPVAALTVALTFAGTLAQFYIAGTILSPLPSFFFIVIIMAGLFAGIREVFIYTVLSIAAVIGMFYLETTGQITNAVTPNSAVNWLFYVITFSMVAVLLRLLTQNIREGYQRALQNERALVESNRMLRAARATLEMRVDERTRDVRLANEVVHAISAELDPQRLIEQVVDLIKERFDLYYAGVFLIDETENFAELKAGTGDAGHAMLAAGHRLAIGGNSMIGAAIAERQAHIVADVRSEQVFFANPNLPDTRSELALPLIARDKVLGALTIQSMQINAFAEEDIAALQGMSDLIAVAIDNAQLFQQSQRTLQELEESQRQQVADTWSRYTQGAASAYAKPVDLPGLADALDAGGPTLIAADDGQILTVPLQLRNEIIGAFSLETDENQWSEDELLLVEAVADQAALALDNVRLIDETRRLAQRERLINEITDNIRRSPDIETILATTLRELGRALNVQDVSVRVGTERELLQADMPDNVQGTLAT